MADFLDEKRKEIQARLKELKPYVDEYQLLQAAEQALSGISNGSTRRPRAGPPPRGAAPLQRAARGGAGAGAGGPRAAARAPRRRSTSCATAPASPSPSSRRRWASSRTTSTA